MTDLPPRAGNDADDTLLLQRVRAGDSDAFGELYSRELEPARRLARILAGNDRAEELVAESFAKVLAQLKAGRGPTDDFRAYLHVTIRNGFRDSLRATTESPASDQPWLLDDVLPPVEELVEDLDRDVAVTALATLPKAWQQVLWHLEVEGRKPAEVAGILDMDAGAVSSLAYRAREGLKRAYLDQHLQLATGGQCGWTQSRMSQYVRGDLSARAQQKAAAHIDGCGDCAAALATVDRVNRKLAAWLFPVVLWGMTGAGKGGLLWIAGAAGVGGAGATGAPINGPSVASGPNPVVLGAAAAVAAAAVAGGVALALAAGDDRPAADTVADAGPTGPSDPGDQGPPPGGSDGPDDTVDRTRPSDLPGPLAVVAPSEPPGAVPTADPTAEPTAGPTRPAGAPTSPTSPPTPPTSPTIPTLVEVVPEPPVETDIIGCGTFGSLDMADTTGVTYALTAGDGTQGAWTVGATADQGYVIAAGAPSQFSGDLGTYFPCIHITEFEASRNGPPLVTPWELSTTVTVDDASPTTITVEYDFDPPVILTAKPPGWTCTGVLFGVLSGPVSCTFDYTGAPPPPVEISVIAVAPEPDDPPAGTVTVYSDDHPVDQRSY